jgi:hypothetical protein
VQPSKLSKTKPVAESVVVQPSKPVAEMKPVVVKPSKLSKMKPVAESLPVVV